MDERTLNDLLECSVCLERLDTSSKVLPCQHTFCRKCLEVIFSSRQELRCPECRVLVDVKIEELPPNVLLMRILEGMKNAAAAKTHQQESSKIQNDNKIENTLKLNEEQQEQIKLKQQQLLLYQQQQVQFKQKQHQIHLQALHQQQLQQSQQQHAANSNNIATAATTTPVLIPPQQRRLVPHAYALYDFESNEPTDLHFKKGDVILLKRKVDINWYVGEINGVEGTFPTNYIQVIVPLPSPQCIALYDFKMGPNEEEGCLTFKNGTLIHVLRRVDHNWAEGRINSTIGIFPIAFVELNPLAKQLLDSYVVLNSPPPPPPIVAQYPQQNTPKIQQNQLIGSTIDAQQQQLQQSQQNQQQPATPRNLPPIPTDPNANAKTPDTTSSSSSRSSQISPNSNTSCSSNSSSSSLPSSPNQSNPTSPQNSTNIRYRDCKEKRHSLNVLLSVSAASGVEPSLSILQANRHSAEILSIPSDISVPSTAVGIQNLRILHNSNEGLLSTETITHTVTTAAATSGKPLPATAQSVSDREQPQLSLASASRVNELKSGGQHNLPHTLPWGYLALYPYKPRKTDELELKKGCVYVVTERCLDGWFKGKNWQNISGVFPGNYVTPLRNRDQQQLMHQWNFVQNHSPLQQTISTTVQPTVTTQNKLQIAGSLSHQPPELPPRQSPPTTFTNTTSTPSSSVSTSVWSKPLGHTVEAFFSRKPHNTQEQQEDNTSSHKEKEREKQKDNSSITTSGGASSTAVSLMKRLTQIKTRSKSPGNAVVNNIIAATQKQQPNTVTYSMDNPSFDDSSQVVQQRTAHINHTIGGNLHPVHVRSGSCPSQLLQSLPTDLQAMQNSESVRTQHQKKQQHSQPPCGGSQRIKGCKERPQLQNVRQSSDGTLRSVLNNINNAAPIQQQAPMQQQQSLTKCVQQAQQQHQQQTNFNNTVIHHRKSQSLDANTISSQIKSSTTTDVGRTAPVTQNLRESRFRCVVSYPPNSELELELHVGDIVYVHRKQKSGWYKGTHARTNKTGLFPASFVEPDV